MRVEPPYHIVEAYKDASFNLRYYENIRFVILPVFFAVTGTLLAQVFGKDHPAATANVVLRVIGVVISVAFWLIELRVDRIWNHFFCVAREVEREYAMPVQYLGFPLNVLQCAGKGDRVPFRDNLIPLGHIAQVLFLLVILGWVGSFWLIPPSAEERVATGASAVRSQQLAPSTRPGH